MTRYCPKCGEAVPSNSITCPKCYTKLPPETAKWESDGDTNRSDAEKKHTILLILTIIPGVFGFLGLGRIYKEPKSRVGYVYLILGLALFLAGNTLLFLPGLGFLTVLKIILGVGLLILYFGLFLLSILDSLLDIQLFIR